MNYKTISSLENQINVHYYADFLTNREAKKIFNTFEKRIVYNSADQSKVRVYGKFYEIKRKQVAYGEPGTFYKFSGSKVYSNDWNQNDIVCKIILKLKKKVERFTDKTFNFVLINRYKDGQDRIGAHRDDEDDLGEEPVIVGLSFGSDRDILFSPHKSHYKKKTLKSFSLKLDPGSIIVMYPPTNQYWTHAIPPRANVDQPRISLTFRNVAI